MLRGGVGIGFVQEVTESREGELREELDFEILLLDSLRGLDLKSASPMSSAYACLDIRVRLSSALLTSDAVSGTASAWLA